MPSIGKIAQLTDEPLESNRQFQLEILSLRAENRTLRLKNGRLRDQLENLTEHLESDREESDHDAHVAILARFLVEAWWEGGSESMAFKRALGELTSYLAGGNHE